MMTLKLKKGFRTRIVEAESFTVLSNVSDGTEPNSHREWYEVTCHRASGNDERFDVGQSDHPEQHRVFDVGYIENAHGKTVETVAMHIRAATQKVA